MVTATEPTKLETRSLSGVEILAVGKWNGDDYTDADLQDMVSNFNALKGKIDPVAKLGHDDKQALAQRDGFPAVGWIQRLYIEGKKLLADFTDIPRRVADLIQAKAYDKNSSEVYFDLELDGVTYHRVLKNVSFLGADMPAVKDIKSISDVAALYTGTADAHVAEYAVAVPAPAPSDEADADGEMAEADLGELLAAHDEYMTKVNSMIAGKPGAKRVRTFLSTARRELSGMSRPPFAKTNTEETDMDTKTLAELLGLPETATEDEITAKIKADKDKPAPQSSLSETEARELRDQVGTLTKELAERKAGEAVDAALKGGKLTPAQKDWAIDYALKDPDGFKAYAEKAPKIAILGGPLGGDAKPNEPEAPSASEEAVAADLGVSVSKLTEFKSDTRSLAEKVRDARAKAGVA